MINRKIQLLLTTFLSCIICYGQGTTQSPEELIKEFFSIYKSESPENALNNIFNTNKWIKESQDQIDNISIQLTNTASLMGDYYNSKLITKASVGEDLIMYSYLVKYERQPLRFVFTFYKPNENWQLQNFQYDDAIDEELEEAIKAYRLRENLPDY